MSEFVDILVPPEFKKSGQTKTLSRAWADQDWIGSFNLWVIQNEPIPAIVYQIRSPKSSWAPMKLDVTSGGHYRAGEVLQDGLREVEEELGKSYQFSKLTYLGRKIHLGYDEKKRLRHNIVDISFIIDNSALTNFTLQKEEVYGLCVCPIEELLKVHTNKNYNFTVNGIDADHKNIQIKVTQDSFPYNWDNYHYKIALLAERFLEGKRNLVY